MARLAPSTTTHTGWAPLAAMVLGLVVFPIDFLVKMTGLVTSGGWSFTLGTSVALAFVRPHCEAPGTKVLLADQWVETGGTMDGAIRLVERQGGKVVGLAAVAIEENAATDAYRARFRCVSGVVQGSRWQMECNAQKLESFKSYKPELVFPKIR